MADDDDTPRNADFIGKVVSDAKDPPETRLLNGWLGDAADEGYRRLYTNAELSAYIDIPVDAILHTEPIRDAQPPGAVFVWIRRDADVKQGGSAFSRAARFLQGQVTRDFASGGGGVDLSSPEKAGYRCITQVPCGEPTGITGKCTKQPEVGGAWPCITAIPHCFEPTGFTGKCTHQPWPNPTHYIGCTFLHCPTQDLTHIQQICHIVATGMPGCGFVDPGSGGIDPAAKAEGGNEGVGGSAERAAAPATALPGCGYTQTWGLCPTLPPKCIVSVNIDCITQTETPGCFGGNVAARPREPGGRPSFFCTPDFTTPCMPDLFARQGGGAAGPGTLIPSQLPTCDIVSVAGACPSAVDACPSKLCPTVPPTGLCTKIPDACPTKFEEQCPTFCGVHCQTQPENCTHLNCTHVAQCPSIGIACTVAGCPVSTLEHNCGAAQPQAFRAAAPIGPTGFLGCTQTGPQCPSQFGSGCRTDTAQDCTFGCTQFDPSCPTANPVCNNPNLAAARMAGPAGGAEQLAGGRPHIPIPQTVPVWHCWAPTPATHCFICSPHHRSWLPWLCPAPPITRTFQCGGGPSAVDACPTRICGGGGGRF